MLGRSRCAIVPALALAACATTPSDQNGAEFEAPALHVEAEGAATAAGADPDTAHASYARVLESSKTGLRVIAGERLLIDLRVALSGPAADPSVDLRFSLRSLLDESMRLSRSGGLSFAYAWTTPEGVVVREQQDCARPRPDDLEIARREAYERSWSRSLGSYERLELTIGVCERDDPELRSGVELAVLRVERDAGSAELELSAVE